MAHLRSDDPEARNVAVYYLLEGAGPKHDVLVELSKLVEAHLADDRFLRSTLKCIHDCYRRHEDRFAHDQSELKSILAVAQRHTKHMVRRAACDIIEMAIDRGYLTYGGLLKEAMSCEIEKHLSPRIGLSLEALAAAGKGDRWTRIHGRCNCE